MPPQYSNQISPAKIEELVITCQKGDSDAFGVLYDFFVNQIYRYIYFRVGKNEAEDLTELVFMKTWENIRQYHHSTHSFSSWIFRIAHNIVVDYYRSNHQNGELSESIHDERKEADTPHKAAAHFDNVMLSSAFKELKDHYRQILILKYVSDLSYEEIAFITGKSHAALRILQFRALRNLRDILRRKGFSETDL